MNPNNPIDTLAEDHRAGSIFRERLMRDAGKLSETDIRELDETVPKKLEGFDLKALEEKTGWIGTLVGRVRTLFEMLRDREFSIGGRTKTLVAAALVYFVLPTDFTPDFIPGVGFIDDALVLNVLWNLISGEIDRYTAFKEQG